MDLFLWLMLFPIIWPIIAWYKWSNEITVNEMLLNIGIVVFCCFIVFICGRYQNCGDTQIYNGEVTDKTRKHDQYTESYSCNFTSKCDSKGYCTQTCQTCYEEHYTVTWKALTTIGDMRIEHLDRTSRSVYKTPDPERYNVVKIGEPVSDTKHYQNWIKGAPESLFNAGKYKQSFPYPQVYDIYRYNRVTNVDAEIDAVELNNALNEKMKKLGTGKHANLQVFTTNGDAKALRQTVENQWLGGKVNDVVVFLGIKGGKILEADAFTWARSKQNELFAVQLRDDLIYTEYSADRVASIIDTNIQKSYIRPRMEDFEYLKDQIDPPDWVIVLVLLLSIGGSLGLTYYFKKEDTV